MLSSVPSQVFVFGDQTNNEILRSFFEKANYALRIEIARLSISQQAMFPRFTSVLDPLGHYRASGGNLALGLSLLTLNHLGGFIKYYGEDSRPYPSASNSYAIGLCTGSFAAAAISTSQTLSELITAALEAVFVAFRTGLTSIEARNDIEHNVQDSAPMWSVIIGMKEQDALSALKTFITGKNGLPKVSQSYLSAVTPNNVTLSEPPSVLEEVLASPWFSTLKPLKLSIHAPYHASHIYDSAVVESILAGSDAKILSSYTPRIPLISCSTGRSFFATNYGSLLRTILHDILIEQLRWDLVLDGCYTEFVQTAPARAQFSLFPVLTNAGPTLAAALSQAVELQVPIDSAVADSSARTSSTLLGKPE